MPARLTAAQVIALRQSPPVNLSRWAARHGVAVNTASQALHGQTWKSLNHRARPRPVDRSAVGRLAQQYRTYTTKGETT